MPRGRDFDESEHPRWPRGTPTVGDAGGGRFRDLTPGAGDAWAHTLAGRLPGGGTPREQYHEAMLSLGRMQTRENAAERFEDPQLQGLVIAAERDVVGGGTPADADYGVELLRHHLTSHYPHLNPQIPMRNTAPEPPGQTLTDFATGTRPVRDDDQAMAVSQLVNHIQSSPPGSVEIQDNGGRMVPIVSVSQERGDYWFTTAQGNVLARSPDQLILWRGGAAGEERIDWAAQLEHERQQRSVRGGANEAGTAQELVEAVNSQQNHGLAPITVWYEPQQEWLQVERAEMHGNQALVTLRFIDGGGTIGLPAIPASEMMEWRVGTTPGRTGTRGEYGTRAENDAWNSRVVDRARELMREAAMNGDDDGEDEGYNRLADVMTTYNDANENREHDMESVDSAVDDLFNELADWDLADEVLRDAGLDEPPNRPNYDVDYGSPARLPSRDTRTNWDLEYPDPANPGELPFDTDQLGEMMRRAWAANNGHGYILTPDEGTPAREAIEKHLRGMVGLDDAGSGMRISVDTIYPSSDGSISVSGFILDRNGQRMEFYDNNRDLQVASYQITFKTDGQGQAFIHQNLMILPPEAQGNGLAARWADQLQKQYRENGMDYVTVHADIDVGGYAWAKAGFDFRDSHTGRSFVERLSRQMQLDQHNPSGQVGVFFREGTGLQMTPETIREVTSLLERSNRGEHITPLEIALLGWAQRDQDGFTGWTTPDGARVDMWLGKAFLLGTDWYGKAKLHD